MPILHADGYRIIIPEHDRFIAELINLGYQVDPDPDISEGKPPQTRHTDTSPTSRKKGTRK